MRKIFASFILLLFLLAGCSSSDSAVSDASQKESPAEYDMIRNFTWEGFEGKPYLAENAYPYETIATVCDINLDGKPEIVLGSVATVRMPPASEVFGFRDDKLVSLGGFVGLIHQDTSRKESRKKGLPYYLAPNGRKVSVQEISYSNGGSVTTLVEIDLETFTSYALFTLQEPHKPYEPDEYNRPQYYARHRKILQGVADESLYDSATGNCSEAEITADEYFRGVREYRNSLAFKGYIPFSETVAMFLNDPVPEVFVKEAEEICEAYQAMTSVTQEVENTLAIDIKPLEHIRQLNVSQLSNGDLRLLLSTPVDELDNFFGIRPDDKTMWKMGVTTQTGLGLDLCYSFSSEEELLTGLYIWSGDIVNNESLPLGYTFDQIMAMPLWGASDITEFRYALGYLGDDAPIRREAVYFRGGLKYRFIAEDYDSGDYTVGLIAISRAAYSDYQHYEHIVYPDMSDVDNYSYFFDDVQKKWFPIWEGQKLFFDDIEPDELNRLYPKANDMLKRGPTGFPPIMLWCCEPLYDFEIIAIYFSEYDFSNNQIIYTEHSAIDSDSQDVLLPDEPIARNWFISDTEPIAGFRFKDAEGVEHVYVSYMNGRGGPPNGSPATLHEIPPETVKALIQLPVRQSDELVTVTMKIPESYAWEIKDGMFCVYDKDDKEKRHIFNMQVEIPQDISNPFARYEGGVFLSQAESVSHFYVDEHYVMRGILHDTFLGADTDNYMYWFAADRYLFVVNTYDDRFTDLDDDNPNVAEHIIGTLKVIDK